MPEMRPTQTDTPARKAGTRSCLLLWSWWGSTPREAVLMSVPQQKETARPSMTVVLTLRATPASMLSLISSRFIQSILSTTCKSQYCCFPFSRFRTGDKVLWDTGTLMVSSRWLFFRVCGVFPVVEGVFRYFTCSKCNTPV